MLTPRVLEAAGHRDSRPRPAPSETAPPARSPDRNGQLIARSAAMRDILALVSRIASADTPVLVQGEAGVGKKSLAREIHRQSRRRNGPLVQVTCGALREFEVDEKLFGPLARGLPTHSRDGSSFLETSRGGTLLLDEVSELPMWAQVKLFALLQPVDGGGGLDGVGTDVRLMATSTRDLEAAVAQNHFYVSLHYYLSNLTIHVPPLRCRQEDIRALAEHFFVQADCAPGASAGGAACRFSQGAWECLLRHPWPGNVLELAGVVARAAALADGAEIPAASVTQWLHKPTRHDDAETITVPLAGGLKTMELAIIREIIQRCRGNKAAAARMLGLHRRTLYRLLDGKGPFEGLHEAGELESAP